jgi:hypothetical protein
MAQTVNEFFDEFDGMTFVQKDGPNTLIEPMSCVTIDGVDQPQGDITRRFCRNGQGGFNTANVSQGTPSSVTFDVTIWKQKRRDVFTRAMERRCAIPIYVAHGHCQGRQDNPLSWSEWEIYKDPFVTSKAKSNLVRGQAEEGDTPEMVGLTYSMSADPDVHELYDLVTSTVDCAAEDEPFIDITTCSIPRCASSSCGAQIEPCDELHITAEQTGAAVADGYTSTDNAGSCTAWAAQPFAVSEYPSAIICVQIDEDTDRIITARGITDAGNAAEIAYSDDDGATWTLVDVGTTNGEFVEEGGCLFALDFRHIWVCTNIANVYFSSDGGLTWTDQNAPTPGASEGLFHIHFIDENFGWAVGGFRTTPTGLFIQTTDGGEHWALATSEPQVERGNAVAVLDANNVWVAMDDGTLWWTANWGTTWTQRTLPSTLANIADVVFWDHYVGALCGNKAGSGNGVADVMRTIDGGFTWEEYTLADEFDAAIERYGVNALILCHPNEIHAVTEDIGTGSLIWTLKPAGWT